MRKIYKKNIKFRKIPLTRILPNILTISGLIVGLYSIQFALREEWERAIYCILIASFFDSIDGGVARMLKSSSQFGAELDSLCDMVNFGVCPVLILYFWLFDINHNSFIYWISSVLFIICMALRLARFNSLLISSKESKIKKNLALGIPAPAGGLLLLLPIILEFNLLDNIDNFSFREHFILIAIYTTIIGLAMISKLPTFSFKSFHITREYLPLLIIIASMIMITIFIYPWYVLPILALFYICSLPLSFIYNKKYIANDSNNQTQKVETS